MCQLDYVTASDYSNTKLGGAVEVFCRYDQCWLDKGDSAR